MTAPAPIHQPIFLEGTSTFDTGKTLDPSIVREEHRANVDRMTKILLVGMVAWCGFGLLIDHGVYRAHPDQGLFASVYVRIASTALFVAVWLRLRQRPSPTPRGLLFPPSVQKRSLELCALSDA